MFPLAELCLRAPKNGRKVAQSGSVLGTVQEQVTDRAAWSEASGPLTTRDSKYTNRIQGRAINPRDPAFCAISPFSWSPRSRDRTRVPTTDRSQKSGTIWHYLALFQGSSLPISKPGNDLRFRANRLVPLFAPNRVVSSVGTSPKSRVSKELGIVA